MRSRWLLEGNPLWEDVVGHLRKGLSPAQIASTLARMPVPVRLSYETIYTSLYTMPRGELRSSLLGLMRRRHRARRPQGRKDGRAKPSIQQMISIDLRPEEIEMRLIPGHWEGDLIVGKGNRSQVGTLVERTTLFVALVKLTSSRADTTAEAFTPILNRFDSQLRRSMTFDQGSEMRHHKRLTENTRVDVYFAHPHAPWERGISENTNGLLRQYLPKGTDLSGFTQEQLDDIAWKLNTRPRKTLGWKAAAELFLPEGAFDFVKYWSTEIKSVALAPESALPRLSSSEQKYVSRPWYVSQVRAVEHPLLATASGATMSRLGFGCSALLGRASRSESERAVAAALDHGITFFDTARSYGYGHSEELLGRLFAGRRDGIFLCTKFGILPAQGGWKQRVKPLARAVVKAFPGLRKAAQRQVASEFTAGQFSVAALQASFETSLRALRTDYVDMLLMHAAPPSVLAQDDLLEALARLVEGGKVRMAGISGDLPTISAYFAQRPPVLTTAQFALNPSNLGFVAETQRHGDLLLVANHPYGGPGGNASARVSALRDDERLPTTLREKLVEGDSQVLPEVVLNCILTDTGVGAVIPAMMQVRHIESNVRALEHCRFTAEELSQLRSALAV